MSENEWTNSISDLLSIELKKNSLFCKTLVKLPYSPEILKYEDDLNWIPSKEESTKFETDLVIYEKDRDGIKPRVIVEAKLDRVTTHDAITYSYKAEKHKNITPIITNTAIICKSLSSKKAKLPISHINAEYNWSWDDIEKTNITAEEKI